MSGNIKSVMNVKASKVNLNPSVLLRKLSDEEVLRNTTPEKFHKTGKQRASVSADTEKSFEVRQSKSDSERKQDSQKKVEVTKPLSKSTEQNPSQAKPSTATEVPQKKVAKPASEAKAQHKPTEGSVIESVKDVVGKETSAPSRSTVTEDLLTQISLSAPVKEVKKVVQVLTLDDIPGKSDKSEGKRSQLIEKDSQKVSAPKEMTTMMTESRNLSVVVPKLPMHISPQKSYNINDPSITPSKAKPRTPTAKEALARKMVKKAKTRANGKGAALNFKRLIGENGNLDNSSDFVETGKTFQPAVRKLRSRAVKKAAKDKVRKPASPDTTVSTEKGPGKTSSVPVNVENKEGKTCLTCKQTIFGTEEAVKEHMKTCLRQRFVSDKHSSRHTGLRHLPEPAEEGLMDLEVSDDESFARHLQQREEDKLMEEQLTDAEFYFCQICGRDLTHLNTVRRTQHINRCIDAMETEKKLHAEQNIKDVPDCPICGKVLESRAQRQSHLKRCAVQYGVTTAQLLELVKKQEEEKEARRKNQPRSQLQPAQQQQRGIKRHHEGPAGTAGKRPRKPGRPVISSRGPPGEGAPHREMDERTQVAMAMSMSLVEKEGSREQPTVTSALPVGGKESKRRKKAAKTDVVPALLVTSKEDREKTLARKVASIIVQGDQESHPKTPSLRKSKLGRKYHTARKTMGKGPSSPSFLQKVGAAMTSSPPAASTSTAASPASSQEKAPLWSMTKRIDEKKTDDFYVQELSKQITPAKYVPVTPMRKAAKKAMLTFTKKNDTSEDETTDGPPQKAVAGSQKAKKTPTATRSPVKKSTPTPTQTQRETANVLAELADEGCSTQEVQEVFTEGQTLLPEPSGFVPDRTPLSPQKMPSSVPSTTLTKLSADLLGMVNSPKLSDLNLLCRNGEVIHVHKFVLVARCPVIAKMLEVKDDKDLAALDFSDYEKDTVLTTLEYMYGGKISLSDAVLAANVLRVAQKLELKELEDSCKAFLKPTFSTVSSSPEFQEKDLPELLDTMLGSPTSSPNLSQGSVNRSSDSQGFNDSELEDIALSQKQRFQKARTLPSKNVNKEPAATKKPTQMVPPAGRGLGQAPERQETGLHVPVMTIGDVVESAIVKNVKQPTRIGPDASPTSAPAHQPILTSTGQTAGVGVRIPVEHSYSTSPRKGTQRGRRGPKTTVAPMLEGSATTVSPAKQPASLAPSMQGIATTVMTSTHGLTTTVMPSTHAVTSTATLSSSQLGVATAVTQASPAQTTMGSHSALPRPGAREQSLIIQSQELSNKIGCPECEKSGVRVSANEAQMLIQGGPAANAMRQLIIARQRPCPHGKYPSWGSQVAPTWMPPHAPEALQGRSAGQLLAGLRSRTPPNSPLRQTAVATVVTPAAPGHTHTSPAYTQSPSGARMQNFAEFNSPPFGPGRPQPDVRLPGSRPPIPPLPGFGILPPGGRLPPASTLLPRTNILAQLREPSQFAQQRYGPQGVVPEQFPTQRSPRGPAISPISSQRSGKELDSPTSSQNGSELIPSRRLLLHTAQRMLPGNQYLSNQFLSPTGLQRPTLHDNTPRLSVVAESSPPPNTSTGVAIIRIPSPMEKSGQGRSERHVSPPLAAVPATAGANVSSFSNSPNLDSTRRMPHRSSGGATVSSASLNSSTADMFAVPDTPPSSGRPKRKGDKRGRGRTPSESDNDTRSAAEALMFMSQRREDSEGSEDISSPPPPGIPGTQVHSASSPKSVIVVGVSNAGGSPMPPSNPAVMHVSRLSNPKHQSQRTILPLPQSWSSLVRRERSTDDCSILKVLLQKGVGAAIPQLYKDQEVPPHIQKQVLKETRLKRLMPQTKQHDVQPASQACGEMVVGRNCSGEVHGGIVVADTNIRKQMVTRESGAGLHDSHSGAQKQCREVVKGVEHGGSLVKQGKDELAGEESGTESLSCPTADELRDSMLFRIVHPETFSPVPKIKGKPVHDGGEVGKVQGKELHAVKLTREKVLTKDCSPMVGEGSRHQKEGNGVAAVCDSDSSVQNVVKQCTTSKVEEDTDCDELRSTFTGPNAKQRRGKATSATTFPSSSPDTMSRHYTSPMLRGSVEIVVNSDREQPASERQEPDIGKVPSIFDNNQGVSIPRDQGNNRVSRRASQRKNQTTPTEATMPSSQATNSVQTRSKGGKQKGETTPSPTKRLRMSRPPEGKRHACTQSPKKFWTDYLKAQLASGNAPAGPVGESMISMQTPDLSAVKPVRRGISSPELALTTPGVTGSTTFQPKFSTPVGSHTQPVGSPRLSLDQELKEAETETVFHGTGPEPYAPTVEKKTSLDSGSQQADDASKGKDKKEAPVTSSPATSEKLQEACSNLNDSFNSTESEASSITRPAQLFVKSVQEGPAVIVQTQSELLSPTIDFHEETIVPRSVSPTPPQSPLTTVTVSSRVSSTASPPASPTIGSTLGQGQGRLLTGGSDLKSKEPSADDIIELSDDDDDVQERDFQDDAKRKRSTPDSVSEAKRPKTDALESSVAGKDVDDDVECIAGNSVDDVGLGDVEKIDLTQEHADETGAEPQQGVCGTEHGCGTPEHEQPSSPSSQSKPAEEQQSQSSQPSVVNDSLMDFFDDGGYMEVPFGGEVECAADSSDDKINLSSVTSKTESKDDKNADELSPSLDATKDNDTTASVPLSPKNASTVIEEFPDTQQEPVHVEEDAHTDQYVVEVVEESPTAGEDVVNNSMYDLEPYHEDHFWDDSNEPQPDESTPVHSVVGSGETGTGAVKSTPLQTHRKSKAPVVPITPMPDYPNMETPELKKQVKKFGVRVLKKPQMVAKLTEIYQYTHQVETDSEEDTPSVERTTDNAADVQDRQMNSRQTVIHAVPQLGEVVETVPCVETATGGSESEGSTDSNSEGEEYEELSDDDDITPSQQIDGGSLKGQLLHWVQDNKELYQKILQYEPIDAENLQQTLKSAGIRCSKNQLLDFLDEQCITFILPSSREKRLKKPRRKRRKKTPPAATAVV
ncbi:uncharacterized protein LOC118419445 isoform X1 [Branchiostoma floridae]|uniref:Structure-specific endonuclease subunit SLX4 n=1 Tax=Branchiostoma floridae TaxID=7739 RepID=A0A9J7MX11_BRAFL|nr:uncharacterized protein LOC118419445 isoform X1 [Branchiostoma floridae]XP_035681709.1 uncharacterized protein LOC118419445 isoform X1 [Branchiostoma floridae]